METFIVFGHLIQSDGMIFFRLNATQMEFHGVLRIWTSTPFNVCTWKVANCLDSGSHGPCQNIVKLVNNGRSNFNKRNINILFNKFSWID